MERFKRFNVTICTDNPTMGLLFDCNPDGTFLLHQFSTKENSFAPEDAVDLKMGGVSFKKPFGVGEVLKITSEDLAMAFVYDPEDGWRASYDDEVVLEIWRHCHVDDSEQPDPLEDKVNL